MKKSFNDDMDNYLDRLYGKKERYIDTVKKQKKKAPVQKVPVEVSEEEVFVEYDDARSSSGFSSWLSGLFARRIPDEPVPKDLPVTEAKVLEDMEEDIEELDHEIEELEEERESMWARFLKTMRLSRARTEGEIKDDILDEVVPVMDEEMRETLKMLHKWLERLSPAEMNAFKRSDDFQRYKAMLEKYGLVKKQE